VITPTRELTNQIEKEIIKLVYDLNITHVSVYGGLDLDKQMSALTRTKIDIVIACPGRLKDLLERKCLYLDEIK